ncbi:MAG: hypothetical protein ACYSTF_05290 [Planctomycetota bacterium]
MITDVEQEYYTFLKLVWRPFSHDSPGSVESQEQLRDMYDTVSLASNEFLRNKLQSLEEARDYRALKSRLPDHHRPQAER